MKWLVQWAVSSSAVLLLIFALRGVLQRRVSPKLIYALWLLAAARLLCPFSVPNAAVKFTAAQLAPELPAIWDRPLSPEASAGYATMSPDTAERNGYQIQDDGTVAAVRPDQLIIFDRENGVVRDYVGGPTLGDVPVFLWRTGAALTGLVILLSNLVFYLRLRKRRTPLKTDCLPPPVYVAEGLTSPCLFGVFPPAIYLTPEAAADEALREYALAHERTHYEHGDWLWPLVRCACLALHWYNPLVWIGVWLSKRDSELACDAGAIRRLGEGRRLDYGRALVDLAAQRSARPGDLLSLSTAMTGGTIRQRVVTLVKNPKTAKTALFLTLSAAAVIAVFVFTGEKQPQPNAMFLSLLEQTTAIRYKPTSFSSQAYPEPIADQDLLAAAKEALAGFANLPDGEPDPDLEKGLMYASRMVLINDKAETEYTLLWQDGYTYLFLGDLWKEQLALLVEHGEGAQLLGVSGTMRSQPGDNVVSFLESLARQQRYRIQEDLTPAAFDYNQYVNQLEGAQGIWLNMPMLHEGRVLTDPGQLKQVKELLALTPLTRDGLLEREENWADVIIDTIAFSLILPDPDWTGADASNSYYIVYTDGGFYDVCSGWSEERSCCIGTIFKENWDRAREILENAPSVDERKHPLLEGDAPAANQALAQPLKKDDEFDEPEEKWEDEWEEARTAEYGAAGVTVDGKNYYYQGQLVNIFLDIRANQSFYTLDTNPMGTVNIKIVRDAEDKIKGVSYMTAEESAELLADMSDDG